MVTAGKIIREEIGQADYSKEYYPNPHDLHDYESVCNFLAPSLHVLLDTLLKVT